LAEKGMRGEELGVRKKSAVERLKTGVGRLKSEGESWRLAEKEKNS